MAPAARRTIRHETVLDELVDIFLADGFADLNLAALARRLHCSKSTLYALAPSKEQLIVTVVRRFFRRATERVEACLDTGAAPVERLRHYLVSISEQLAPATPAFFAALDAFSPAREIYRQNTTIAARRVQDLVRDAAGPSGQSVNASFVGSVAGQVMEAIHRGEIKATSGLDDSAAYRALADLIVDGVAGHLERKTR
jgi:AcrR family transcriptional regulator